MVIFVNFPDKLMILVKTCSSTSKIAVRTALFFSMFLCFNTAFAQTNYWDVILLNSAEVVRGTITDSIPGESVTILAGDSLSRTIPKADIHLMSREVRRIVYTRKKNQTQKGRTDSSAYYQGVISGGFGIGMDNPSGVRLNFINGFGSNELWSLGAGVGLRMPLEREVAVIPLFLDLRIRFSRNHISPIMVLGVGPCFQPSQEWDNTGPVAIAEAGISIKKSGKSSVLLTVGIESYDVLNPVESRVSLSSNYGSPIPVINVSPSFKHENIQTLTLNLAVAF